MIKPDARIVPTEDEFIAWEQHPVTQFIAEGYRRAAEEQRAAWVQYFEVNLVPADLTAKRLELRTREDAYRSILENTLADYRAIIEGPAARRAVRPQKGDQRRA